MQKATLFSANTGLRDPIDKKPRPGSQQRLRIALLTSSAIIGVVSLSNPSPATAQQVIDDGNIHYVPQDYSSPWDISGDLIVGNHHTASLIIRDGGDASATRLYLGFGAGSVGSAALVGSGTSWRSEDLVIGRQGTGHFTVANGEASSNRTYIGLLSGSQGTAFVRGADAVWDAGFLNIGAAGAGFLTVESQATLNSSNAIIGTSETAAGTVSVTGPGSLWSTSDLTVGLAGDGTLAIENGGRVLTGSQAIVGQAYGKNGTVSVTGSGSMFENADRLYIGAGGGGTLDISAGGAASARFVDIGFVSDGSVLVTGSGSSLEATTVTLGYNGSGTLRIADEGQVTTANGVLGGYANGTGIATVTGAGSHWTTSGTMNVGMEAVGELNIENAGRVTSAQGIIGSAGRGSGTVKVTGGGSSWDILDNGSLGNLHVGYGANGTLNIAAAGTVTSTYGHIGNLSSGIGTVNVGGPTSSWQNARTLAVGGEGQGTLTVTGGGIVTSESSTIGQFIGSNGSATVTGSGSRWSNSNNLTIGGNGTGALEIADDGLVENARAHIGSGAGSTGSAVLSGGGTWTNTGELVVGFGGEGSLDIGGGSTVSATELSVARNVGSTGAVTVTGDGSIWTTHGALNVGLRGTGTLAIEDGGKVESIWSYVGNGTGSTGTVMVSGDDSVWSNSLLVVGELGSGTMNIEAGGKVENINGYVGLSSGSSGTVAVSGEGSLWTNSGILQIGGSGNGELAIESGGRVENSSSYVGFASGVSGTVAVSGSGSVWSNSGTVSVGAAGIGSLGVSDGGSVSVANGSGSIALARDGFGIGTINIGAASADPGDAIGAGALHAGRVEFGIGAGALNFNHTESAYDFEPSLASTRIGHHSINQYAGITRLTGDSSAFAGMTTVSGGSLIVADRLNGAASVTGGRFQADGIFGGNVNATGEGAVSGTGTITGDVRLTNRGVLSGTQGSTLTIGGDLALDAGSDVNVTLGGAPAEALFDVAGDLTLAGSLNVIDRGGLGIGVYRLFDYAGSLTDKGLAIGSTPAGIEPDALFIQTSAANQVNLVSSAGAELGFWDGGDAALRDNDAIDGGSGRWRADGRNWTTIDGALNGPYRPNPTFAIFQGRTGTVTVDASAGAIGATGMQFVTDGYRIEGDSISLEGMGGKSIIRVGDGTAGGAATTATIASSLTGSSRLVKTDLGTLILESANSYAGGTELRAGTLSVFSDAHLGAASGDLIFSGGILNTSANFDTARAVTLDAAGRFDVAAETTLGLTGTVSGSGDLVKTGSGTLTLSGVNSYQGDALVEAGTLVGNAASVRGSIRNASTVIFDQGADAAFAGDIAGLGGTDGQMIKRGGGVLALDGASSLDWTVEAGGLVSASERFSGDLALGTGASFAFDQNYGGAYAGAISGAGDLIFTGGGAVQLTGDSSGFTGLGTVEGSTLIVNEAFGGSLAVLDGGVLGGAGTVGSGAGSMVTIASGGILAPGNSIGRLKVDGDLLIEDGSRYEVEVAPGGSDSDSVAVTGTATLEGGTVAHIGATGEYDLRSTYTILSAGTLDGEFGEVTSDFAFLTPDLIYDYGAGTVDLELTRNDRDFVSAAATRNQIATANGIEGIGLNAGHAVYDAIAQLADDDQLIRASFDALSGEIHASVQTALVEDSRFIRNAANDRIRAAFAVAGASYAPVLAYGPGVTPMAVGADHAGPVFWSHGFGSWGSTNSDNNAASLDRSIGGLLIGADGLVGDWRVGLLAGYSRSTFKANDRVSSGSSDNYHLGLYGGTQWGDIALRTGAAYTWHDIETNRSVAIPGLSDSLTGSYGVGTVQAFGELGYGIDLGDTRLEPFVNLAHVHVHTNSFTEAGGAALLTGSGRNTDVTFTTLGVRGEHAVTLGKMEVALSGMVGWRHALGDTTPESTHAFSAGDAFTIDGGPIARNSAVIEAGLDLDLTPDATFGLSYQGQLASGAHDHGFRANLAIRF
ncbi:autotransporter domain-containing protein [Aquamicrobium sp. LC103]|uniref:autotransporter domain-containing protein n=1 Tax=Aquamicrobium sp. LC103 TaxID=1120658 RepID=UPI000A769624|nr:autotransporter domain-containing protein [Aquamicrobium sp. LC103]